ncbi:Omp28-related outer membrane protein [bacterium]|nr:Omp28-related outer membrane protein [bacterium]
MKKTAIALSILLSTQISFSAQRLVLFEEMTNASCAPCAAYNPGIESLLDQLGEEIVIQVAYHAWWPGYDPMYQENVPDNTARIQYYGVNGVPDIFADGILGPSPANPTAIQNDIMSRYNAPSPFTITLTDSLGNGTLYINASVTAEANATPSQLANLKIHFAIVETRIYPNPPGSNGENEFRNALRMMLPNSNGETLTISAGETLNFSRQTSVGSDWDFDHVKIVAFIQNTSSKEIMQAAKVGFLGGTVFGTITDSNGNPLENVAVSTPVKTVYTNQIGTYEVDTFAGTQVLSFYKYGYTPATQTVSVNSTTSLQQDLTLTNSQTGTFSGTLLDATSNAPIPDATIELIANEDLNEVIQSTLTNANGVFTFNSLPVSVTDFLTYHTVKISPSFNYPNTTKTDTVTITANLTTSMTYILPRAELLVVVNDGLATSETIYEEALNTSSTPFFLWDVGVNGTVTAPTLDLLFNKNVLWSTGNSANALTSAEKTTIETFLNSGGKVILAGENVMESVVGTNLGTLVGATVDLVGTTHNYVKGVSGSPFCAGKLFSTAINSNQTGRDALALTTGQVALAYGPGGTFSPAMVYNSGTNWKLVTAAFSLEGIGNPNGTPTLTNLDFLLKKINDWFNGIVEVPDFTNEPETFKLSQNFPNPFNPETTIAYRLPNKNEAKLTIFNLLGEKVREFELKSSQGSVVWNGKDFGGNAVSSGVYFYKLESENFTETKKMLLLK